MIVAIDGEVSLLEPTHVHLKTASGLTYQVNISVNTAASLKIGNEATLRTAHIIREDAQILYGFATALEKEMFERLIKINGVGPSTAMAICSTFMPESFMNIVQSSDINSLKMVPGIGPKSAKRILVELGDFSLQVESTPQNRSKEEAKAALESLGFKSEAITIALKQLSSTDTSTLVKEALKLLSKSK
jgi:Holliday junction DNA helicase RuvA